MKPVIELDRLTKRYAAEGPAALAGALGPAIWGALSRTTTALRAE
jgi:hypothetical protein